MIDADMMISLNVKAVVTSERVTVDDTVGHDSLFDDRHQGLRFGIFNDLGVDLPSALQDAENGNLARSSSPTLSFASAAKVTLIDLYFTVERPLTLLMGGNGFPASLEEENSSVAIHAGHLSGCSSCRSCNEQFHKLIDLALGEFAPLEMHGWQCKRGNLLGQPLI